MLRSPLIKTFVLTALLCGCEHETPEETAAKDARAVAEVEALQKVHPPVQAMSPEPLTMVDLSEFEALARPSDTPALPSAKPAKCAFATGSDSAAAPILIMDVQQAAMKIDGELSVLASDSGSAKLAPGIYRRYAGRTHWLVVSRTPDRLTIHDRFDRLVYEASGSLRCTGSPAR